MNELNAFNYLNDTHDLNDVNDMNDLNDINDLIDMNDYIFLDTTWLNIRLPAGSCPGSFSKGSCSGGRVGTGAVDASTALVVLDETDESVTPSLSEH